MRVELPNPEPRPVLLLSAPATPSHHGCGVRVEVRPHHTRTADTVLDDAIVAPPTDDPTVAAAEGQEHQTASGEAADGAMRPAMCPGDVDGAAPVDPTQEHSVAETRHAAIVDGAAEWLMTDRLRGLDKDEVTRLARDHHVRFVSAGQARLKAGIEFGQTIEEMRRRIPYGEWEAWFTSNFPGTGLSLATKLRRVAKWAAGLPASDREATLRDLSLRDAIERAYGPHQSTPSPAAPRRGRKRSGQTSRTAIMVILDEVERMLPSRGAEVGAVRSALTAFLTTMANDLEGAPQAVRAALDPHWKRLLAVVGQAPAALQQQTPTPSAVVSIPQPASPADTARDRVRASGGASDDRGFADSTSAAASPDRLPPESASADAAAAAGPSTGRGPVDVVLRFPAAQPTAVTARLRELGLDFQRADREWRGAVAHEAISEVEAIARRQQGVLTPSPAAPGV